MIETTLKDYLAQHMNVPAYFEFDSEMPETFLIIGKVGSGLEEHLKRSVISIQSYAKTLYAAAQLNERVKSVLLALTTHDDIVGVHLNSDYNFTDVSLKKYRYQAVFDVTHY